MKFWKKLKVTEILAGSVVTILGIPLTLVAIVLGIGAILLGLGIVIAQIVIVFWLFWEWAPFGDKYEQRLFYTKNISVPSADMQKIQILDFSIDIENQRVIQKVVSPLKPIKRQRREQDNLWIMTKNYFFPLENKFSFDKDLNCAQKKIKGEDNKDCEEYFSQKKQYLESEFYKAFIELEELILSNPETLTRLDGCVIKSSDDWICKSKWFGSDASTQDPTIGKKDGEWVMKPAISSENLYEWKAMMAIERFRCGDVCVLKTKTEKEEQQKQIERWMREREKRREKK